MIIASGVVLMIATIIALTVVRVTFESPGVAKAVLKLALILFASAEFSHSHLCLELLLPLIAPTTPSRRTVI